MVNVYVNLFRQNADYQPLAMILIILSLVAALIARYRWSGLRG